MIQAGYISFDSDPPSAPSDGYYMLWVNIDDSSILLKYIPSTNQPIKVDRDKSRDPRSRKQYHKLVHQEFCTNNLFCMKKKTEKTSLKLYKEFIQY